MMYFCHTLPLNFLGWFQLLFINSIYKFDIHIYNKKQFCKKYFTFPNHISYCKILVNNNTSRAICLVWEGKKRIDYAWKLPMACVSITSVTLTASVSGIQMEALVKRAQYVWKCRELTLEAVAQLLPKWWWILLLFYYFFLCGDIVVYVIYNCVFFKNICTWYVPLHVHALLCCHLRLASIIYSWCSHLRGKLYKQTSVLFLFNILYGIKIKLTLPTTSVNGFLESLQCCFSILR